MHIYYFLLLLLSLHLLGLNHFPGKWNKSYGLQKGILFWKRICTHLPGISWLFFVSLTHSIPGFLFLASSCVVMLPLCGHPSTCHLKWLYGGSWTLFAVSNRPLWDFHTHLLIELDMNKRAVAVNLFDVEPAAGYRNRTDCSPAEKKKMCQWFKWGRLVSTGLMRPHRPLSCGRQSIQSSLGFFFFRCVYCLARSSVVLRRPGTRALTAVTQRHVRIKRARSVTAACEHDGPLRQPHTETTWPCTVRGKSKNITFCWCFVCQGLI